MTERILQVEIFSFENPRNLEYRSDSSEPYCCCGEIDECSDSLADASTECSSSCDFIYTVCSSVAGPSPASDQQTNGQCFTRTYLMNRQGTVSLNELFSEPFSPIVVNYLVDANAPFRVRKFVLFYKMFIHAYTELSKG